MKLAEWKFTFHLAGDHHSDTELANLCEQLENAFDKIQIDAMVAAAKIDHHIVVKADR
jgi:hypothetical protein